MQSCYSNPQQLQAAAAAALSFHQHQQRLAFPLMHTGLTRLDQRDQRDDVDDDVTDDIRARLTAERRCKSSDVLYNTSQHVESDADEDDADLIDGRAGGGGSGGDGSGTGVDGREEGDAKLNEDAAGRDLLAQLHHQEHADRQRDLQQQACDAAVIRRRKRTADHVTPSPSLNDDDDEEDYIDFGLSGSSPSRQQAASDDAASSPSITPRPPPSLEQTEIKIQRPLGLLAQHGITTKTSAALQARTAHRPADLDQTSKDRQHQTLTGGLDFSSTCTPLSLMDRRFMPSPPAPSTPLSCLDPGKPVTTSPGAHHWTFEEQFKQLYDMSPDPKRKEFLDDLFSFMQKRGTPVNRIPIMAKQTLDLYELFRLVVSKGGLVEVINKKLWREITKGLNLPSSITSAAFTLRTQYMKYLYPYECEKLKLSTLSELQSAIDGNRREGRRPGYGYEFSPLPASMLSTAPTPHLNGAPPLHPSLVAAATRTGSTLSAKEDDRGAMSLLGGAHLRAFAEHDARAMEAATRAMEEVSKRMEEASRAAALATAHSAATGGTGSAGSGITVGGHHPGPATTKYVDVAAPPCKRPALFDDEHRFLAHLGVPSARLKMTTQSNGGRLEYDNSMVVSMEINGLMYQGVLFAQHPHRI